MPGSHSATTSGDRIALTESLTMQSGKESPDYATREIEATTPRLRNDLRWTFQKVRGESGYLLEDPVQGRFYRLGPREYEFARGLDGHRTVAQLVARSSKGDSRHAIGAEEAASLVRMLVDAGLVVSGDASQAERVWDEVNRPQESKRFLGRVSQIIFLKVPLGNPDRFFTWLASRAGWFASPGFALVWLLVIGWGGFSIHGERERFFAQMSGLFDFGNLWALGALWLVLKVFHECWHGFVCRYFGGAVPEAGFTLLLFTTPLGYVNASSSTAFPSRWQRMAVSGAGMYGEVFVAAIAAILWARVETGVLSEALHQVVVLSSVTTILFNANPLMRFDGYYLLSDLLDIPNLGGKGQGVVGWMFRRGVLGMKKAKFPLRRGEPRFLIGLYGIAAFFWKVLVVAGILVGTAFLMEGAGLIVAIACGGAMALQGIASGLKYLKESAAAEGLRPARLIARMTVLATVGAAALVTIKVTPVAKAPAVVRDGGGGEVRVRCPGFLREMKVTDGQRVEKGDILAVLENPAETGRLRQLETEIQGSRLRRDRLLAGEQIAGAAAEAEHLASLEQVASELGNHVATLSLSAPRSGRVDLPGLERLLGTWLEAGSQLGVVQEPGRKEILILASPEDQSILEEVRSSGSEVIFRPQGRWGVWPAVLSEIVPRAGLESAHFALIAPAGGPLPVRQGSHATSLERGGEGGRSAASDYELTKPRFEARAVLADGEALREGEIGTLVARSSTQSTLLEFVRLEIGRILERLTENQRPR